MHNQVIIPIPSIPDYEFIITQCAAPLSNKIYIPPPTDTFQTVQPRTNKIFSELQELHHNVGVQKCLMIH